MIFMILKKLLLLLNKLLIMLMLVLFWCFGLSWLRSIDLGGLLLLDSGIDFHHILDNLLENLSDVGAVELNSHCEEHWLDSLLEDFFFAHAATYLNLFILIHYFTLFHDATRRV